MTYMSVLFHMALFGTQARETPNNIGYDDLTFYGTELALRHTLLDCLYVGNI